MEADSPGLFRGAKLYIGEKENRCDLNNFSWFDKIDFDPTEGIVFTAGGRATAFEILLKSGIMWNMELERLKEGLERVKDP